MTHSFSHLCGHISVIDVQRKENAVNHVCLLRCPCSPARVWNCKSLFGAVSFNQPQITIPLFSVFAFASPITFSSDWSSTRGPVFLVQVLLNHVLQASAAFWFILFALYLDCTGQRWSAIILNVVASVRTNVFQKVLVRRFLHREKTSLHSVSNPSTSSHPRVTFMRAQKSRKDSRAPAIQECSLPSFFDIEQSRRTTLSQRGCRSTLLEHRKRHRPHTPLTLALGLH